MRRLKIVRLGKTTTRRSPKRRWIIICILIALPLAARYIVETFNFKPANVWCKGSAGEIEHLVNLTWHTMWDTSTEKMKFKFHPRRRWTTKMVLGLNSHQLRPIRPHRFVSGNCRSSRALLYLFLQSTLFARKSSSSSQNRVGGSAKSTRRGTRTKNILHSRRSPKTSCYLVDVCKVFVKTFRRSMRWRRSNTRRSEGEWGEQRKGLHFFCKLSSLFL